MSVLSRLRSWYARFERPISSISLIGGFVFDAVTLRRVDLFWENIWVVGHLVIVTACAVWLNLLPEEPAPHEYSATRPEENPERIHFWLVNVMQFFFGGILSTYLVFYFRGATLAASWPFLLILAAAFIANERLKRHYARLTFQVALLFLAFYAFAIYLMPILFREISTRVFIASGVVSLAAIAGVLAIITKFSRARFTPDSRTGREKFTRKTRWSIGAAIAGIFIAINALYMFNLIPPLPLSLMDGNIYHAITVNAPGQYTAQDEAPSGSGIVAAISNAVAHFFRTSEAVHLVPGDPLVAYTAIFAPTALNTTIIHEWQYYSVPQKKWITASRVTLPIAGGADSGWHTFSRHGNFTAGQWRVNVLASNGGVIGRLDFSVVLQNEEPALVAVDVK